MQHGSYAHLIRNPKSAFRNHHGRLPERARLGTIAVAFIVAVRDREAGVAGFNRKEFKNQTNIKSESRSGARARL
jgi:hypothetical protein